MTKKDEPIEYTITLNHYQINAILGFVGITAIRLPKDMDIQRSSLNLASAIAKQIDHLPNAEIFGKPCAEALIDVMRVLHENLIAAGEITGEDVAKAMAEARTLLDEDKKLSGHLAAAKS